MKRALALELFHNPGFKEGDQVNEGHLTVGLELSRLAKQSLVSI